MSDDVTVKGLVALLSTNRDSRVEYEYNPDTDVPKAMSIVYSPDAGPNIHFEPAQAFLKQEHIDFTVDSTRQAISITGDGLKKLVRVLQEFASEWRKVEMEGRLTSANIATSALHSVLEPWTRNKDNSLSSLLVGTADTSGPRVNEIITKLAREWGFPEDRATELGKIMEGWTRSSFSPIPLKFGAPAKTALSL